MKYRTDITTAIKYFRPVLSKLYLRNRDRQQPVFLAEFDHLDMLEVDYCVVSIVLADLKTASSLFFCRKKEGIINCYIVLNNVLYDNSLEKVKITGIHEFCHFLAIVYTIAEISTEKLEDQLIGRLSKKIDELNMESLNKLYNALNSCKEKDDENFEFPDSHFRLDCEGNTIDYSILFRRLLFSKELFEETFTKDKQKEFKRLMESSELQDNKDGASMYINTIKEVAECKDIPEKFAVGQALSWAKEYLK